MLDERSLRREPFSEGYAVELADGNRWTLPAVKFRVFPDEREDGTVEVKFRPCYAEDVARELDVLFDVEASDFAAMIEAKMTIASRLLRSNYDLPRGAVGTLLAYYPGDAESERRWDAITQAILGRDPARADADEEIDGDPKDGTPAGSASP